MPRGTLCHWIRHKGCMKKRQYVTAWEESRLGEHFQHFTCCKSNQITFCFMCESTFQDMQTSEAPGLVACTQHVFIYQMRSRATEKINSTDKQPPLPSMCDGEPIWIQQDAVVKHVTKWKRSSQMFLLFSTEKRLLFHKYHKSSVNIHTLKLL